MYAGKYFWVSGNHDAYINFYFFRTRIIRNVFHHFKRAGDFADLVIVMQALNHQAKKNFSFDKKLQKSFPEYVVEKISPNDL